MRSRLALLLYMLVFTAVSGWVAHEVAVQVPRPYMDEEFHVAQTRTYCEGRWSEWHPKITTLPGLYLTAVPYARTAHAIQTALGLDQTVDTPVPAGNSSSDTAATADVCSVSVLRSLNVVYGLLCIPLYFALLRTLHPTHSTLHPYRTLLAIMQLSVLPLNFFFAFLFYTDLASVFWTLAAYLAHLRGYRLVGALLGVCAVVVRQTNVAWVGFMLLSECLHAWRSGDEALFGRVHAQRVAAGAPLLQEEDDALAGRPFVRRPIPAGGEKEEKIALESYKLFHTPLWTDVPRALLFLVRDCLVALPRLLVHHAGAVLTCVCFVVFVVANSGSVVVGDRDNHSFHAHWPQLLYFIAFASLLTLPNWLGFGPVVSVVISIRRHPRCTALLLLAMGLAVHYCTSAHPFLLADNRHYMFYVWKNLFRRWTLAKYALLPWYILFAAVMQRQWCGERARSRVFQLMYWCVTALCLVPTPLLEPRYFLTPFIVWFLHSAPRLTSSTTRSMAALGMYVAVNAVTLLVFLRRPFTWGDGSEARFMW